MRSAPMVLGLLLVALSTGGCAPAGVFSAPDDDHLVELEAQRQQEAVRLVQEAIHRTHHQHAIEAHERAIEIFQQASATVAPMP